MSVTPAGEVSLKLGTKIIAGGHWQLFQLYWIGLAGDERPVGTINSSSAVVESDHHAIVTDTYPGLKAVYDLSLIGEDLHIVLHLQNLDQAKSLKHVSFTGLNFKFARPATGTLQSWHSSYLASKGQELYYPGLQQPVGAVYAKDDQFGFAVHSDSDFEGKTLFVADFEKDGIIPADCRLQWFTTRDIAPASSADFELTVRISADLSSSHLLGAYKQAYDRYFPGLFYHPDNRPLAAFTGITKPTAGNPYGFNGRFRRLDTAAGTAAYIRLISPSLQAADALGVIFWSPGGYRPPMYPPDFDVFPDAVADNIPALVSGFKKRGLRVGLCARCGEGVIREPGKEPTTYRLSASNPVDMQTVLDRFRHAMRMGFDVFYLDSFGADCPNDLEILKQIRKTVGPDVLLYTEYCTDQTLPYAGHYCEWRGDSILWDPPEVYQTLRMLCPESTWLCVSRNKATVPAEFAKLKLVPLVDDMLSNRLPASRPAN